MNPKQIQAILNGTWTPPGIKALRFEPTYEELKQHHEAESKALMAALKELAEMAEEADALRSEVFDLECERDDLERRIADLEEDNNRLETELEGSRPG